PWAGTARALEPGPGTSYSWKPQCWPQLKPKDAPMFETIARFFGQTEKADSQVLEPRLAVAALLIHLASVDGASSREETEAISKALKTHYGLGEGEVKRLMVEARRRDRDAVDLYQFTARLARLEETEKIEIIAMMWQVVFADDSNHELE